MEAKAADVESRSNAEKNNLIEKINKLTLLMQNTTKTFKEHETEKGQKISELSEAVENLSKKNERIEMEKKKSSEEAERRVKEVSNENEDLKEKYQAKLNEVRDIMTVKIAQVRRQVDDQVANARSELEKEIRTEWDEKHENQRKTEEAIRVEITDEFAKKEAELEEQHQFTLRNLMNMQAEEMKEMQKKLELANTKLRKSLKDGEKVCQSLQEVRMTLRILRKKLPSSIYKEIFEENDTKTSDDPEQHRGMKSLLDDLALRMRELKDLRRSLERQEQRGNKEKQNDSDWEEEALSMEIKHNSKVIEAEHLKKLIRQKQLEVAYKSKRQPATVTSINPNDVTQEPYFVMLKPKLHSASSKGRKQRVNDRKVHEKKTKVLDSGRSEWLERRHSTVQFNPTNNARNVWHRPDLLKRLKYQRNGYVDKGFP
uniref:CAP-Gly domain-containing linker protein 1-like n=1 Tax=Phallusia mammillata TaxID=59560 RepID=A0A6F9D9D0_9ASCI|nr:CAP-Gly domain-containing linker protein 1-like [Phallusia mammillata]